MEAVVLLAIFGGMAGVAAGLVGSGFWEAFCLITARPEPTHDQVSGLVLGGACTGIVLFLGTAFAVFIISEARGA